MSTYDRRHLVIQWGGSLPGGEIWSCSLRGGSPGTGNDALVPPGDDIETWIHGYWADTVSSFHARPTSWINAGCKLEFLKVNPVDINGHYTDPNTHEHVYPAPVAGGGVGTTHPTQIAWCVSLTTGLSRGPAHRGRFYLPMPAVQIIPGTGLAAAQYALELATSAATFITEFADTPGADLTHPFKIFVMSRKAGFPATHPVTGVEVGCALDTQRRRRNQLDENYQAAPVDQGAD